jgi:hypothetical protein
MKTPGGSDLLIEARSALLDALEALQAHRDSVIVIGAQAIYLHTGAVSVALAEMTKDSDLALDARALVDEPLIEEAMRAAGFSFDEKADQLGAWLFPAIATAATAVCVVVVALLVASTTAAPRLVTPGAASAAMPRYYITLSGLVDVNNSPQPVNVTVHRSSDGRVTGTTTIMAAATADAEPDDRTFIIEAQAGSSALVLYRLSITASGGIGHVARVGSFTLTGVPTSRSALSADGTMLAFPLALDAGSGAAASPQTYARMEVIDLVTGTVRTWSSLSARGYWAGSPAWGTGDSVLTFPWLHATTSATSVMVGTRQLDLTAPGTNLLASRLTLFPASVLVGSFGNDVNPVDLTMTAGPRYIVASSCTVPPSSQNSGSVTEKVLELSASTGRIVSVLRSQTRDASGFGLFGLEVGCGTGGLLAADATGQHLLVEDFQFGRIDNGVFTALPGVSANDDIRAAW